MVRTAAAIISALPLDTRASRLRRKCHPAPDRRRSRWPHWACVPPLVDWLQPGVNEFVPMFAWGNDEPADSGAKKDLPIRARIPRE
jgi:hypothetical protein